MNASQSAEEKVESVVLTGFPRAEEREFLLIAEHGSDG